MLFPCLFYFLGDAAIGCSLGLLTNKDWQWGAIARASPSGEFSSVRVSGKSPLPSGSLQ
ncbi:MAG: hypothetical protein F6J93_25090 [Oscillatoria sp. SIO1A7]|nr:hypothetical protein [Oscillatoria sp. SIO1A7]